MPAPTLIIEKTLGFVQIWDQRSKTISRLFSKTIISFSRLEVLQTSGRDWIKFEQNEKKNITYKALVVAFKKNSRLFTIFAHLISIFQTISISGKLLDKFQDLFITVRLYEPWIFLYPSLKAKSAHSMVIFEETE